MIPGEYILAGAPIICNAENFLLEPGWMAATGMGFMEGFTHQSSLLYLSENIDIKTVSSALDEYLSSLDRTAYGITVLPIKGLLVRVMGHSAEQLFDAAGGVRPLFNH